MRPATLFSLAAAALGVNVEARLAGSYKQMLVFGASYCDNAHRQPTSLDSRFASSPYFKGRFSNGIVLSEHLANLSGISPTSASFKDHAFAGAVVSNTLTSGQTDVWDIGTQVQKFENSLKSSKRGVSVVDSHSLDPIELSLQAHSRNAKLGKSLSARHQRRHCSDDHAGSGSNSTHAASTPGMLVVVEIGLNTLKALLEGSKTSQIQANVNKIGDAVSSISKSSGIHGLSPNGHIDLLVLPMFPLDSIPNWSENNVNHAQVRKSVNTWNAALNKTVTAIAKSAKAGDRIFSWDAASFWTKAEAAANGGAAAKSFKAKYGITLTNAKDACYGGSGSPCSAENTYFYWDSVHPTTMGHLAIAHSLKQDAIHITA